MTNNPSPKNIVMIGDSVFDNGAYVDIDGKDLTTSAHAAQAMPSHNVTCLAVDGAVTRDVASQLGAVYQTDPQFVVSVGGNDALGHVNILAGPVDFMQLADIQDVFADDYANMIDRLIAQSKTYRPAVCTIYKPRFQDHRVNEAASVALSIYNDTICEIAMERHLSIIDLRQCMTHNAHYANAIEPSHNGGMAIAHKIRERM